MNAVEKYRAIASQEKFKGWPCIGGYAEGSKIPFFGKVLTYNLETPDGIEEYHSLLRHFGWCVVFGVNTEKKVITLVQWKPGVNKASWELPPGGIGKVASDISPQELLERTQAAYLKETGYGQGNWSYLGRAMIETGKYRGASPNDHGLPAHLMMAEGLVRIQDARQPNANEIMETLEVPLDEFRSVIESGLFEETSAIPCALLSLIRLGKLAWQI